ncbi:cytochrome c1 [Thalassorhabdomicrobium marinisediminis]|uniref:Cytochrome c1 n=1 Tax=Thalassorhabdomicrobium marinisediminis TaxID=2170577 RepID=A0A2T7G014_9RHOB|nr:cytochrome c1 [Thalassorhabdomicrobium marinisediminis]PVA07761.1 cytochrome c1 [Thalassorhabdomicrobium marinisediminis]
MFRKLILSTAAVLGLASGAAYAAGSEAHVEDFDFSFEGPFGSYDTNQLQRGLQIYTEICAGCHGLKYVSFRNLHDEGGPALPEDQMRAYAEFYEVFDETLFDGEGDFRPATPADRFPESNLASAPDLSLMAKARAGFHGPYGTGINQFLKGMGGAEYIASLLNGYAEPPACAPDDFDGYYNTVFTAGGYPEDCLDANGKHTYPGSWIAMAPPLYDGAAEFADGHANDVESMSADVAAFLMWTAEPKLNARKQAGLTGVIFLVVLSVLLYLTNKRLWAPHKGGAHRKD